MRHIYLFIGAAIITYLLISLATLDLMWCVHNTPWIWISVIPLFLFLYFSVFMCFHEEMGFREDRAMQQTLAIAKANKLIEKLQEQLPNMFQGLVDMSMAEIRDSLRAVNEEQARKVATLSTDIYNVLERRQELLDLERRVKQHKGQPMLLTKRETASLLLVDYSTLRKWSRKGFLVPTRITSHRELYRYSDVLKILEGKV